MKGKSSRSNSVARLLLGGAAIALAAGPLRKSPWKYPLYSLAGFQVASGINSAQRRREISGWPAAPERLRSDLVDGIEMRWEEHGTSRDGPPVVMVHGLPTNPRIWRYVISQLVGRDMKCFAWEQVGFGGSMEAGLDRDLSIPRQAQYLYQWLQHQGISEAIFVGHDYGGGVVQQLLVDHPEVVKGVVLADSVAFRNWPVPAVRAAQALGPLLALLPSVALKPILYAAVRNLHSTRSIHGESFEKIWRPYGRSIGARALAHQLRFFRNKDTERVGLELEWLGLSIPAHVVWGERDPLGLSSAERLATALNAQLTIIPSGRHFSIEDHPEVIADAVRAVVLQANEIKQDRPRPSKSATIDTPLTR